MATEEEAQLDLLNELLQDAAGEALHHEGDAPALEAQDTPCANDDEGEMSAEDVLQQLDNVTLSLDAADETAQVETQDEAKREQDREETKSDESALLDAVDDSAVAMVEPAATAEQGPVMIDAEEEVAAELVGDEDKHEEEFADASETPIELSPNDTASEAQVDAELAAAITETEQTKDDVATIESATPTETTGEGTVLQAEAHVVPLPTVSEAEDILEAVVASEDGTSIVLEEGVAVDAAAPIEEPDLTKQNEGEELHESDDPVPAEMIAASIDESALMGQSPVEAAATQSSDTSGDGSWEVVAPPTVSSSEDADHTVQPPPAPMMTAQPLFSGSLNPGKSQADAADAADDNEDSDSDSDDDEGSAPPPPLPLDSLLGDDEEELEVDTAVAEEILAATKKKDPSAAAASTAPLELPADAPTNSLLDALENVDLIPKSLETTSDPSKADEITLGFDDAIEVRSAQVLAPPVAHPESSAVAFGIGYQSLRKRPDNVATTGDDTYNIAKGPTFQELEHEVTLVSDASLSSQQRQQDPAGEAEEDDFGSIPDYGSAASPTRVDAILQKTRTSFAAKSPEEAEAALVEELKKATFHEKQHLHDMDDAPTGDSSKPEGDNALTLKELHSMYKRGLGDQEVRILEDEEDTVTRKSAYDTTDQSGAETPAAVGGLLSKPALTAHAIAEEGEEDDEEQEREVDTLNDEDADAVTMNSERMTFDDQRSQPPPQASDALGSICDWKEIQLAPASSDLPSATQKSAQSAMADANAGSKISYAEALQYFLESDDVLVHRDRIIAEEKTPSASCFSCFSRPRLVFGGAIEQRDRLFCVAATSFDAHNTVHVRMLQTIYRRLVNSSSTRDVPLMGQHWETIGFQGSDPSTDLRGCGVLSLLQMLHVVESHTEFARRSHSVSQHPVRHFPLACAMINVTLQCVVALRTGALYKESNKRGSVFEAANALHVAIATQLMKEIQSSSEEIPLVMKRVLDNGRQNPDRVLETHNASKHALTPPSNAANPSRQSSRKSSAAAAGRASSSHAAADFTEIGLHSVGDEA